MTAGAATSAAVRNPCESFYLRAKCSRGGCPTCGGLGIPALAAYYQVKEKPLLHTSVRPYKVFTDGGFAPRKLRTMHSVSLANTRTPCSSPLLLQPASAHLSLFTVSEMAHVPHDSAIIAALLERTQADWRQLCTYCFYS